MRNVMRDAMRIAVALSLGTLGLAAPAAAQRPSRLELGTELRLTLRDSGALHRGWYSRRAADSVVLRECFRCAPVAYALADLASLERWQSHSSGKSVSGGALMGLAAGAALAAVASSPRHGQRCVAECGAYRGVGIVAGGLVGLVAGTVAGHAHGQHGAWEAIPLPAVR